MIKVAIFDLDNTLYDYKICNDYAKKCVFLKISQITGLSNYEIESNFSVARTKVKLRVKDAAQSHSRLLYIQEMMEEIEDYTNFKLILDLHKLFWNSFFEKMKIEENILLVLKKLKENEINIGIITDLTSEIQFKKIIHLKIDPFIKFIVTSEEAGVEKPNKKIFEEMLRKMNCKPAECVMIGDDIKKDIKGANLLGIKTIYVEKPMNLTISLLNKEGILKS